MVSGNAFVQYLPVFCNSDRDCYECDLRLLAKAPGFCDTSDHSHLSKIAASSGIGVEAGVVYGVLKCSC